MALLLGLPHEPPVAAVAQALAAAAVPYALVDQRRLLAGSLRTWSAAGTAGGILEIGGETIDLEAVTGVYTRLTTWSDLPEIAADPPLLAVAAVLHRALEGWLETTPARVVNRTSANDSNNSKPYQAMIIRDHFEVPATLVTNQPDAVRAFRSEFGEIVYKSVSGERSIVTLFADADLERLSLLSSAPVQFQEYVRGVDVRAHVVGREVHASRVRSGAVDYRYDRSGGGMEAVELPAEVAEGCIALTARLGLELSGIDLRYAEDGRIVCFEVNPSPAFTVYEETTGQPIAAAVARRLAGG